MWPFLLFACVPRAELVTARAPTPVELVVVTQPAGSRAPTDAPASVYSAIEAVLSARLLTPTRVDSAVFSESFSTRRSTAQRLSWLAARPGDTVLVLVETEVEYYSEMNGRYRWTVSVVASVLPPDRPLEAVEASFEIPVFLSFYHEREDKALEAAVPVLSRRLGELVDTWVAGQTGG